MSVRPTAGRTSAVTRYEYATAPLIVHALQQILNQWGADGWELVSVVTLGADGTGAPIAFFKRPLADG
jgi:hypothetical protein